MHLLENDEGNLEWWKNKDTAKNSITNPNLVSKL